jgi:hypothetical protein
VISKPYYILSMTVWVNIRSSTERTHRSEQVEDL